MVRVGTLCAVNRTGTGAPASALSFVHAGRSRSANASISSGCCAHPSVKSMRRPEVSTARR